MFDTQRFIAEIEKRPEIYNTYSEVYTDKEQKNKAWEDVCEIMVPKWQMLTNEEKSNEEKILRGKWRNIRDYFMKELKLIQKTKKGKYAGKKRRKYVYFDQLHFLLPNLENKIRKKKGDPLACPIQCKNEEIDEVIDETMNDYEMPLAHEDIPENYATESTFLSVEQFPKSICETSMTSTAEDYSDIPSTSEIRRYKDDEEDYDKMFLLSLLPILRRIPEDNKLDVRIQMQQALSLALRNTSPNT